MTQKEVPDRRYADFVVPYYLDDLKRRISVARVDERLYAFDDLCTCGERSCPLSGGLLTGTTLMCQCHGSRFDVTTGVVINGPATSPLNGYLVREAEGEIQIRLDVGCARSSCCIRGSGSVGAIFDAASSAPAEDRVVEGRVRRRRRRRVSSTPVVRRRR